MENLRYKVVACNTLRDEINYVMERRNLKLNIEWIDSGLHNFPDKLNSYIQKAVDNITIPDNILLLFGYCGRAIDGIYSNNAKIIFPKVDDCISLFLGGMERKKKLEKKAPAYYFTKGYLENENNIWNEYQYCINKYGKEKAIKLMKRMLNNYEYIRVIDTGAYPLKKVIHQTKKISKEFELKHEVISGNLNILDKALRENWDLSFIKKDLGEKITLSDIEDIDYSINKCLYQKT